MSQNNVVILNFEAHKPPTFKEKKGVDYIQYGIDRPWANRYPDFLIDLYNRSAIHRAIVNGKSKYIAGEGWKVTKELPLSMLTEVNGFINNAGNDSLFELTSKIAKDRELFGGFALQTVWDRKKEKVSIYHIDFSKLRVSEDSETYYYTSDWSVRKPEDNEDYKEFTNFDANKKGDNQIIYYKDYAPNLQEYPLPPYLGGINYISADIDISTFVASNTSNGFNGGTLVNLYNGEPEVDKKRDIQKQFKDKFQGSENAGAVVISFNDPEEKGAEILPLSDNGQDERFINLNEQVRSSIFTAHEATNPVLFGVKSEGGMANNADEIRTASEYLQNTYVSPRQKSIIDVINEICLVNGWEKCLDIQDLEPIKEQISLSTILSDLTVNERRALAGYEPIEEEESTFKHSFAETNESFFNSLQVGYLDEDLEVVSKEFVNYNPFKFASVSTNLYNLLIANPDISIKSLARALAIEQTEVDEVLKMLSKEGKINYSNGNIKIPTEEKRSQLITVYKYQERNDVPSAKSGSRDFCRTLMAINRSYTRAQINTITNEFGTSVWNNRGGWYNNPDTGVTTPYCRHIWEARTVKLKNK